MFCKKCGYERQDEERFCPVCGTQFPTFQEESSLVKTVYSKVSLSFIQNKRVCWEKKRIAFAIMLILLIAGGIFYKVRYPGISKGKNLTCYSEMGNKQLTIEQMKFICMNRFSLDQITQLCRKWGFTDLGKFGATDKETNTFASGDYQIKDGNLCLPSTLSKGFAFSVQKISDTYYTIDIRTTDITYNDYILKMLTNNGKRQLREKKPNEGITPSIAKEAQKYFGTIEYNEDGASVDIQCRDYGWFSIWSTNDEGFYNLNISISNHKFI